MSDLTFNKIAGGVLATGLAIFLLKEVTTELFAQEPPEKMGYAIAVVEETTGGPAAAPEVPPDWGTVLPAANIENGKTVSAKCASCHTFTMGGADTTGPNLFGLVGRKPATHGSYPYSEAMKKLSGEKPAWTHEILYEYLVAPQKYVPGTKMTFIGLKQPQERIDMIAYLQTLGSSLPIPAPNPAAAAPAAPAEGAPAAEGAAAATAGAVPATPTAPAAGGAAAPTAMVPAKGH